MRQLYQILFIPYTRKSAANPPRRINHEIHEIHERWRRGAKAGERPRMTDKPVAGTRLNAPRRPVYLHTCRKQALSIRCHADQYAGFLRICPAGAANPRPRYLIRLADELRCSL